jgi:hypothetical protein
MKGADNETIGFGGWPHSVATVDAICQQQDFDMLSALSHPHH